MKDVIDQLKEQNKLTKDTNDLMRSSVVEFMNLQKLLAAESRLGNARRDVMDETLQKLLAEIYQIGVNSKRLLDELSV